MDESFLKKYKELITTHTMQTREQDKSINSWLVKLTFDEENGYQFMFEADMSTSIFVEELVDSFAEVKDDKLLVAILSWN